MAEIEKTLKRETKREELSVIVFRQDCVLAAKKKEKVAIIDQDTCKKCGLCIKFGCPAIEKEGKDYRINKILCNGCNVCASICTSQSISVINY